MRELVEVDGRVRGNLHVDQEVSGTLPQGFQK